MGSSLSHRTYYSNQSQQEENLTVSPAHAVGSAPPPRIRKLGADAMADL